MTVLIGVLLPALSMRLHLNDGQAGQFFAIQFLAATAASTSYHWTGGRWAPSWTVLASFLLMSAGAACFIPGGLALARMGVAIYGLALGLNITASNLLSAALSGGRRVRALNLLNMSWCAGAVLGPALSARALLRWPFSVVMASVALLLCLAALSCVVLLRTRAEAAGGAPPDETSPSTRFPWEPAVFLFLYVGVENSLSGWLPTLGLRRFALPPAAASLGQSAFWVAILAGRGMTALLVRRRESAWMIWGILLALMGVALILWGTSALFFTGAAVAGFGLGPQFPTAVALYQQRAGRAASRWLGPLFAAGGLGGAVLPYLLGLASSRTGSLTTAATALIPLMGALPFLLRKTSTGPLSQ